MRTQVLEWANMSYKNICDYCFIIIEDRPEKYEVFHTFIGKDRERDREELDFCNFYCMSQWAKIQHAMWQEKMNEEKKGGWFK